MEYNKRKIIVAITGASGSIYAKLLLSELEMNDKNIGSLAVIFSDNARQIYLDEIGSAYREDGIAKQYNNNDFYVPMASGSGDYDTMIVCPASMGIIGRIANGFSNDLISRAADVMLKEGRKLILVPREMPYNLVHIRNMEKLMLAGAVICPASPSFYSKPLHLNELAMTVVERILILAGFRIDNFKWAENDR